MRISVITVVYNNREYLEHCISSVLSQNYDDLEYIVIDGASSDGTLDIIKKYSDSINKIVSEPDRGIYDAMNKGLKFATGDVIGFLNSDDVYADNDVLSRVAEAHRESGAESSYGDLIYMNKEMTNVVRYWKSDVYDRRLTMKGWMPPHPTFYVRKSVYDKLGGFNTDLKIAADYDLILRFLLKNNITSHYIPEVLVKMRLGGDSNRSVSNISRKMMEDWKAMKINGLTFRPYALLYKNFSKIGQFFHKMK